MNTYKFLRARALLPSHFPNQCYAPVFSKYLYMNKTQSKSGCDTLRAMYLLRPLWMRSQRIKFWKFPRGPFPRTCTHVFMHTCLHASFSICMSYRYLWWSWRCCWQRLQLNGHNSAVSTRYIKDVWNRRATRATASENLAVLQSRRQKPGEIVVAKLCSQQKAARYTTEYRSIDVRANL